MLEVRILFGFLFARIRDMNAIVRDMFGYGFCGWTVRTDFVRISYFVRILYVLGFCVLLVQKLYQNQSKLEQNQDMPSILSYREPPQSRQWARWSLYSHTVRTKNIPS